LQVEVGRAGFGHGAEGELGVVRGADFVCEAEVERGAESAGDHGGDGDAAAWKGEDEETEATFEIVEGGGELEAGVCAISKCHVARGEHPIEMNRGKREARGWNFTLVAGRGEITMRRMLPLRNH